MPDGAADPPIAAHREFQALARRLDAAAAADLAAAEEQELEGLAAALRITALLLQHGCGWSDALSGEPALAKRCGRLGSEFPAEQRAAYIHALRLLARRRRTWSALLRMPAALYEDAASIRARAGAPVEPVPQPEPEPVYWPAAQPDDRAHAPPDGDWATTIAWLTEQRAWLDASQRLALEHLASRIAAGHAPDDAEAVWLRELWWQAELRASPRQEDPR